MLLTLVTERLDAMCSQETYYVYGMTVASGVFKSLPSCREKKTLIYVCVRNIAYCVNIILHMLKKNIYHIIIYFFCFFVVSISLCTIRYLGYF